VSDYEIFRFSGSLYVLNDDYKEALNAKNKEIAGWQKVTGEMESEINELSAGEDWFKNKVEELEKELQKYKDVVEAARELFAYEYSYNDFNHAYCDVLRSTLEELEGEGECSHAWINADNEHVKGCEICTKCKTIRATPE